MFKPLRQSDGKGKSSRLCCRTTCTEWLDSSVSMGRAALTRAAAAAATVGGTVVERCCDAVGGRYSGLLSLKNIYGPNWQGLAPHRKSHSAMTAQTSLDLTCVACADMCQGNSVSGRAKGWPTEDGAVRDAAGPNGRVGTEASTLTLRAALQASIPGRIAEQSSAISRPLQDLVTGCHVVETASHSICLRLDTFSPLVPLVPLVL